MIGFEKVAGLPLEEAKQIASGEGASFPDVIYTASPAKGEMAVRHEDAVTRIIGVTGDGRFIAARFNELLETGD